jgi:colanic acid/amylovoran biosynthesis glycosyltransferase
VVRRPARTIEDVYLMQPNIENAVLHVMSSFDAPVVQTFILRELRQLRARGWNVLIGEIRPPRKDATSQGFDDLVPLVSRATWLSWDLIAAFVFFLSFRPKQMLTCLKTLAKGWSRPSQLYKMTYVLLSAARLAFRHREMRFDLVRATFLHTEGLAAYFIHRLLGVPYTTTVYTVFVHYPAPVVQDILQNVLYVVADTNQAKTFVESFGVWPDRIEVVHNSVSIEDFPVRPPENLTSPPTLLAVGRLIPKKGSDVLLTACAHLRRGGANFRCVIVGDGVERERLLEMRRELELEDVVEMVGGLPSFALVKPWYYRASLFVMSSIVDADGDTDGLPTVVVEAMASGLPIVGTRTGGIPEAVEEGSNGFLVPERDPKALADRIQILLDDSELRKRLGMQSRRIAEARFNLDRKAEVLSHMMRDYLGLALEMSTVHGR